METNDLLMKRNVIHCWNETVYMWFMYNRRGHDIHIAVSKVSTLHIFHAQIAYTICSR